MLQPTAGATATYDGCYRLQFTRLLHLQSTTTTITYSKNQHRRLPTPLTTTRSPHPPRIVDIPMYTVCCPVNRYATASACCMQPIYWNLLCSSIYSYMILRRSLHNHPHCVPPFHRKPGVSHNITSSHKTETRPKAASITGQLRTNHGTVTDQPQVSHGPTTTRPQPSHKVSRYQTNAQSNRHTVKQTHG